MLQVFAYTEAIKTVSADKSKGGDRQPPFLRGVTLLDPLGMLLFGVHKLGIVRDGYVFIRYICTNTDRSYRFRCDDWLPVTGNVGLLDDLERFKDGLHLSLLRVFEGLGTSMARQQALPDAEDGTDSE